MLMMMIAAATAAAEELHTRLSNTRTRGLSSNDNAALQYNLYQ